MASGLFQAAGPGGLARSSSGMTNLARVSPTSSSSLYRLGSLAALSPAFLGISAPAAPRRSVTCWLFMRSHSEQRQSTQLHIDSALLTSSQQLAYAGKPSFTSAQPASMHTFTLPGKVCVCDVDASQSSFDEGLHDHICLESPSGWPPMFQASSRNKLEFVFALPAGLLKTLMTTCLWGVWPS